MPMMWPPRIPMRLALMSSCRTIRATLSLSQQLFLRMSTISPTAWSRFSRSALKRTIRQGRDVCVSSPMHIGRSENSIVPV